MKLPEPAPRLAELVQKQALGDILELFTGKEIQPIIADANRRYLYWDKLKYLPMPPGVRPDLAWMCVKLSRGNKTQIPGFVSKGDHPFSYFMSDTILEYLHSIDQDAAGRMLSDEPQINNSTRQQYIVSSLMEEAIASSQLEGAAATREVAKKMLREKRKPVNTAEQMILNNYVAIQEIRSNLNRPMTLDALHDLHRILTEKTLDHESDAGRLRTAADDIHVVDPTDGVILHTPPPALTLPAQMQTLLAFANDADGGQRFIHPVIKALILHFWLSYEHPYVDGNGRTARALFYWYMLRSKYWLFEFVSVSRILLRSATGYARAFLYSEVDEDDLTYFLHFNLRVILLALADLNKYLAEKRAQIRDSLTLLKQYRGINLRQRDVLAKAVRGTDTQFTLAAHASLYDVVYQTARTDLMGLKRMGLLDKIKSGRRFVFIPSAKLRGRFPRKKNG